MGTERALPHYWPAGDERDESVWWCRDRRGVITERITTAHESHSGHVKCVRVADQFAREVGDV